MEAIDNIATAIEAGTSLAGIGPRVTFIAHPSDDGNKIPIALVQGSECNDEIEVLTEALAILDGRAPGPRRREGTIVLTEVDSFIAYAKRYGGERTIVYAHTDSLAFVAVLDDHPAGPSPTDTAWRGHRARYACPKSPEWLAWTALDGVAQPQDKFADFIEGRLEDLATGDGFPKATDVLQMARNLLINTKGTFQRQLNPTTGDSILVNKTETETGSTVIPRAFLLGIPVFEGGARYQVEARVRFGFSDGRPAFTYTMHRRKEIERDAFGELRATVHFATTFPVLAGSP